MAIEYSLDISSDLTRDQAFRLLANRLDAELTDGFVYKPDILIGGSDIRPGRMTEVIEEAFHFTPTLSILFRRQYGANGLEFDRLMLRATLLLLEHGRDAVLLFNGEIITLQRLAGELVFNSDPNIALDEALIRQEVHLPYARRSLRSPLL